MEKLKWETVKVKAKELVPLEINPRKISEDKKKKLIESLDKFNLVEIPAVNKDLKIIGGNQRVTALIISGRGDELIDVRVPNRELTEKELKEYVLISNTHAGEFDFDIIDLEFSEIDLSSIGFDINGFDHWKKEKESTILDSISDDDDIELDLNTVTTEIVEGDVIDIGDHRLLCGSSTSTDNWEKIMKGEMGDLMVTDPPYNVSYVGKTKDALKIKNDKQTDGEFFQFLKDFYTTAASYTKPGGAWYVWHADSEGANFRKAMSDSGILLKQCLIWVKNSFVMGRQDYHWMHEPCLYGWKEGGSHKWHADRKQTTVLNFDRPQRNAEHPTMKPIPLIAYLIQNSSIQGDIVMDGFGGSGTTMVASHKLKRKCRMIELDPKYCQVIVDRMLHFDKTILIKLNGKTWNTQTIS